MKYITNIAPFGAIFSTGLFKKRYWRTNGTKVTQLKVEKL